MAQTKYGHLVKKLVYNELPGEGEGTTEYITWPKGSDLEGINLSFVWGYHNKIGKWAVGGNYGHVHPYNEVLLFAGLDFDNPNTLGAEVVLTIGEEGEEHIIAAPSTVILPAGVPHCPIVAKKVDRPYGFLAISASGEEITSDLTERGKTFPVANKYGDLITRMEMRDTKRTRGGNADFLGFWTGKDNPGFNLNFTWAYQIGVGAWHDRDPHVHKIDEALFFVGMDPDNPDYLGAEIEIAMGEEREIHVFDTPTVVIAPKGLVHCPLITRRVERPYCFSAIFMANDYETKWLGEAKK
jgi:hypothetical protein